jgi:hypothetical protein
METNLMFTKEKPIYGPQHEIGQYPHCDQRILHAPGECEFCDHHPESQALRRDWGICFTGYTPDGTELPCPADHARGEKHTAWAGNKASNDGKSAWCGESKTFPGYFCTRPYHEEGPCALVPIGGGPATDPIEIW